MSDTLASAHNNRKNIERTPKPRNAQGRLWNVGVRIASPIALVALWQIASVTGFLSPRILAAPSDIIATAARLIASGELITGLAVSFLRVAAGFSIAVVIGITLALLSGLSRLGEAVIDPPIQMLKAMPFLGLLPLFILWFGIGEAPKIGLVAFGAIFPIYLTLHGGIRGIDKKLIEVGQTLDLGTMGIIRHIVIPGALPSLLVGIRYGLSVAWLSLVVGEQINASSGLGYIITYARDFLQTDIIVVCLLVYAIMGLLTDGLVRIIEAYALRWRPQVIA
ncbi:sulfonate transport system permease protein [Agrobacterium larrymoorei]|uniref:Sulfonate transport system permease protein n=1 Tax=Agrobacterium larrymoorei TaxID=160699 RepID=A0AAJ2EPA7_9HYPH|nr:ABC transporter permease subunit [Agrobacterium larrymoorei]MDR6099970.1 sulfonate transport system permease protein [Agrobacterium larrymoorei]